MDILVTLAWKINENQPISLGGQQTHSRLIKKYIIQWYIVRGSTESTCKGLSHSLQSQFTRKVVLAVLKSQYKVLHTLSFPCNSREWMKHKDPPLGKNKIIDMEKAVRSYVPYILPSQHKVMKCEHCRINMFQSTQNVWSWRQVGDYFCASQERRRSAMAWPPRSNSEAAGKFPHHSVLL